MQSRIGDGKKKAVVLAVLLIGLVIAAVIIAAAFGTKTTQPAASPAAPFEVTAFNVGKADALLLTTKNGTVLIDTGEEDDGEDLVSYLEDKGRTKIDYLIVTHFDKDHVGGADILLNQLQVDCVYQTNTDKKSEDYEQYLTAVNRHKTKIVIPADIITFELDGAKYTIYPPGQGYKKKKSNNSSLIVGVEYGETSYLFMGDAMEERVGEFLDKYDVTAYDVLKMPYHGNYMENLPQLLDKVKPQYTIITSSLEKREDVETITELEKRKAAIYLTREGTVTLESDGNTIWVK